MEGSTALRAVVERASAEERLDCRVGRLRVDYRDAGMSEVDYGPFWAPSPDLRQSEWRPLAPAVRPPTGHSFVRHTGNIASGGHVTDLSLATFLASGRNGPEHQELWRLIGTLVGDDGPKQRLVDIA